MNEYFIRLILPWLNSHAERARYLLERGVVEHAHGSSARYLLERAVVEHAHGVREVLAERARYVG